jgi:hypothetical protein
VSCAGSSSDEITSERTRFQTPLANRSLRPDLDGLKSFCTFVIDLTTLFAFSIQSLFSDFDCSTGLMSFFGGEFASSSAS